jgi:hypothetical protein
MTLPVYPPGNGFLYPLKRELRENEHVLMLWGRIIFPLPGIESRFLGYPVRSLSL